LLENRDFIYKNGSRNFLAKLKRVNVYRAAKKRGNEDTKQQPVWYDLLTGRKDKLMVVCLKRLET